ncbi:hypothetical protein HMPREF9225_1758 [Peptoniphilus duerdenii ATCC BAA-1640]|uniref:Uncharacterized protein n=1 Tax=Peptoniphilus duerdenii ATCC BAA-1640 TaxID=862517 RepID=E0NNL9_9FIRM|nr:hypothetical protein HMPREF9225_1758 [Peptoniphilus duerdenii ATCC BAA-1640]
MIIRNVFINLLVFSISFPPFVKLSLINHYNRYLYEKTTFTVAFAVSMEILFYQILNSQI